MPINTKPTAEFPLKPVEEMLPIVLNAHVFVIADTETTGFGAYDDLLEVGAVKVDVDTGKILGKFSSYCKMKGRKKVPAKITELTGIQTEDVENAPNVESVLTEFKKFIGSDPLVFHNASFDWRMLNTKYKLLGITLKNEVVCSMRLFKYLHPDEKRPNLERVTAYYGSPIVGHHRAYIDCKWTAAAFRKMRQEVMDRGPVLKLAETNTPSPIPKHREFTMEDIQRECTIHRINPWKKHNERRIYCTTNLADFFYDMNAHVWNVARNKTQLDLNVDLLAQFLLDWLHTDLAGFQAKYAP